MSHAFCERLISKQGKKSVSGMITLLLILGSGSAKSNLENDEALREKEKPRGRQSVEDHKIPSSAKALLNYTFLNDFMGWNTSVLSRLRIIS